MGISRWTFTSTDSESRVHRAPALGQQDLRSTVSAAVARLSSSAVQRSKPRPGISCIIDNGNDQTVTIQFPRVFAG